MRRFFAASAGLAASLVVSLVLVTAGGSNVASEVIGPAEQLSVAAPAEPQPVAAAAQHAATARSGLPNEGIKVHGRWVIEVMNPDGTLADRREFDNALIGGAHLSALLARTTSVGKWAIELRSSDAFITGQPGQEPQPCGSTTSTILGITITTHHPCTIAETASGFEASPHLFETLTVMAPAAGQPNAGALVLSGSATARADASIKKVTTSVAGCAATDAPATPCATAPNTGITSTTLATPVAVLNGQQIQVSVVISFQ